MAAASVLTSPQYGIVYPTADGLDTFPNLVTTNVTAYQDGTGQAYDLTIGASSNIVAQSVQSIMLEHGGDNNVVLSTVSADGTTVSDYMSVGMSNSRVTLKDINNAGMSLETKDAYIGSAHFVEDVTKMTLSMPSLSEGLIVAPPVAMQSSLAVALDTSLNQNLYVTGDTGMQGRLVTYGGIFTPDFALYKASTAGGAAQVGYSWKINDKDQLELVKYTFFGASTSAVSKKVAVFGTSTIASSDASDVAYTASLITTSSGSSGAGSSGGGAPGFSSATTAFTVTANGGMYTSNSLAIGTDVVDPAISLKVIGVTESDTFVATTNVSSPAFLTTSDERLKDLYAPISGADALTAVMGLSPLTYSWKDDASHVQHAGFTAQNIGAQMPLAVQTASAGKLADALHIDNTAVLAYLVAAVKELGSRINTTV